MTAQWFANAVKPDVVESHLREHVPELLNGSLRLTRCQITRIRSMPPTGAWAATYELELVDSKTGVEWTYATKGLLTPPDAPMPDLVDSAPFGTEGWSVMLGELRLQLRAIPADAGLPGLAAITDPEQALTILGRVLDGRESMQSVRSLTKCSPTIVSHKPGIRATVRCGIEYEGGPFPSEDWPDTVVIKIHHDDEGLRSHEAMRVLSDSPLGSNPFLGLARPLAYVPELRMSVQDHVRHRGTLKDLFVATLEGRGRADWGELTEAMRATAAALAALHQCGIDYGESVTFSREFAILRTKHAKLATVMPALRDQVGSALDRIEVASGSAADTLGPAHHSFRPAQVLLDDRVSFIDFDKFCGAEPGSDIASLTTKLLHMGVNKIASPKIGAMAERVDRITALRAEFLTEYERNAPVSHDRLMIWEAYEFACLVLSAAKKADHARIDNCSQLLEDHLQAHGI
ncbi:MAG: hypothetical protein ACXWDH_07195 [Aeromicrobium sp.]